MILHPGYEWRTLDSKHKLRYSLASISSSYRRYHLNLQHPPSKTSLVSNALPRHLRLCSTSITMFFVLLLSGGMSFPPTQTSLTPDCLSDGRLQDHACNQRRNAAMPPAQALTIGYTCPLGRTLGLMRPGCMRCGCGWDVGGGIWWMTCRARLEWYGGFHGMGVLAGGRCFL